jgi:hypothetical protein
MMNISVQVSLMNPDLRSFGYTQEKKMSTFSFTRAEQVLLVVVVVGGGTSGSGEE